MSKEGGFIGKGVSLFLIGNGQRLTHPLSDTFVPALTSRIKVNRLPDGVFLVMGATVITPRDEERTRVSNFFEGLGGSRGSGHTSRIFSGTDYHKEVVHKRQAFFVITFANEFFFSRFRVHQQNIGIAHACLFNCSASAGRGDLECVSSLFLKLGLQVSHQTRVVDRRGRRHADNFVLRLLCTAKSGQQQDRDQGKDKYFIKFLGFHSTSQ